MGVGFIQLKVFDPCFPDRRKGLFSQRQMILGSCLSALLSWADSSLILSAVYCIPWQICFLSVLCVALWVMPRVCTCMMKSCRLTRFNVHNSEEITKIILRDIYIFNKIETVQRNIDLQPMHCWLEISQVEEHRLYFPSRILGCTFFHLTRDPISRVPGRNYLSSLCGELLPRFPKGRELNSVLSRTLYQLDQLILSLN